VVLTELHPASVSLHFLVSPALLIFCVALWMRAAEGDEPPHRLTGPLLRGLGLALCAATAVVLVAGTVVTGTGPHAGDTESRRYGFDIQDVTRVHSLLAWVTVALTVVLLAAAYRTKAPAPFRRRVLVLFAVELAQGLIGYVQYLNGVPAPLVVLHMLGAAAMWIAALRVVYATRERGPVPVQPSPETAAPRQTQPA
jgi:cytochrome c oxidase assembly protein subunit 15